VKSPEILRRLVRRFGLLLALIVIGGAAGAVYGATKTPTYTAKAYVVAIGDTGDPIGALNFAQAYGRVATTGPVMALAGPKLGTDRSGLDTVTASTSPDAPVIEITATGPSAQHTAAVANAVANALADLGNSRKADTHVSLAMLAAATTPTKPTSPKPPLELAVGAAAGLLIGGLAVLAGVGRASAARYRQATADGSPTSYDVDGFAEFDDGQATRPLALVRFTGSSKVVEPPKEITAYRGQAAIIDDVEVRERAVSAPTAPPPSWPMDATVVQSNPVPADIKIDAIPVPPPAQLPAQKLVQIPAQIPAQRVVGRAVVAQPEDDR
jgi:capsular polysaccharide biosynthesis protein